jgi:hypothetical protein
MKKIIIVLAVFALALAACSSGASNGSNNSGENKGGGNSSAKATKIAAKETKAAQATSTPTRPINAKCTLLGQPADTVVPQGTSVVIFWEWVTATLDQAQAGVDNGQVVVTLDGQALTTIHTRQPTQDSNGKYNVTWWSNVGALSAGTHTVTYSASWKAQVSDGTDTYGPGGTYETQSDTCTITVQ